MAIVIATRHMSGLMSWANRGPKSADASTACSAANDSSDGNATRPSAGGANDGATRLRASVAPMPSSTTASGAGMMRTTAKRRSARVSQPARIASDSSVISTAVSEIGPSGVATAAADWTESAVPDSPSATGSCLRTNSTPMAASIPLITGDGT
ncbi:hypothetical protein OKW29_008315 [Paraburkholderia sp. CI3]